MSWDNLVVGNLLVYPSRCQICQTCHHSRWPVHCPFLADFGSWIRQDKNIFHYLKWSHLCRYASGHNSLFNCNNYGQPYSTSDKYLYDYMNSSFSQGSLHCSLFKTANRDPNWIFLSLALSSHYKITYPGCCCPLQKRNFVLLFCWNVTKKKAPTDISIGDTQLT